MNFLTLDLSDNSEGISTLEALASTTAEHHPAALAEAQQLLDWAWRRFPHTHGPADEGMDWDHDLQVNVEDGGWHAITLTITGTHRFIDEFIEAFGDPRD
jgi:hypothetical protein